MAADSFPIPVRDVVSTLVDIYRHQHRPNIVELLANANAHIEETGYNNWDGGITSYTLMLDIPVSIFAANEAKIAEIETDLGAKLTALSRGSPGRQLTAATIIPLTSQSVVGPSSKPVDAVVKHIWKDGYFRLFISHVSAHKLAVAKLKNELEPWGISAFVAHQDIKPSLEWQSEIELALSSMHALAALLTPDFHSSNWTDQEVGYALGKGTLVVPVQLGVVPYGFIGKVQGLSGSLEIPGQLANLVANTLRSHAATRREMRRASITAFVAAQSFANAIALSKIIAVMTDFTDEERAVIKRACEENRQIYNATGVVSRVRTAAGIPAEQEKIDVPF